MTITFRITVFMILAVATVPMPIKAMNPRKLDDTTPTTTNHVGSLKPEIKCGACYPIPPKPSPSPPPPSPPPPSPPPPSAPPPVENCPPPPSPPPPVENCPPPPSPPPPVENCPPPPPAPTPEENCPPASPLPPTKPPTSPELDSPPPPYVSDNLITGPPSELYPVMETISAARRSFTVEPLLLVVSGLLLAFW